MHTPVPDYLDEVLHDCGDDHGEVADYIPELARADPDQLAAAITSLDGETYTAGDDTVRFSIQSISKPFSYALALQDLGWEELSRSVGSEPSGDAFNEISLEVGTGRPLNPMINIGAITTFALVEGADAAERFERVRDLMSAFAGRRLEVDEAVFTSELEAAHRNLALAYMVRSHGVVHEDPQDLVREYTRQCALSVDVRDLAVMAATLAHGGINPVSGDRIVERKVTRQVLSVMTTCGMYDAAGDWVSHVGIPAKSGVSGAIMGALPGQVGIGTFSPRLDRFGNSTRGVGICERLSSDMGLHMMGVPASGLSTIRGLDEVTGVRGGPASRAILQGPITFAGGERALRELATIEPDDHEVVVDLTRVSHMEDIGRRMLLEGIRRLTLDGHFVTLVDPDGMLPDPNAGDGIVPHVVDRLPDGD